MAFTTYQSPDIIQPVYSPILFTHSSSLSSLTGFRYKYDLKTKDGTISTKRLFPFPNDLGRIDISPILRNYTTSYFNPTLTGITNVEGSLIQYSLDTSSTGSTTNESVLDSGIKYAFNGVDENFIFTNYLMTDEFGDFLTNSPTDIDVYLSDYYTLNYLNGEFSGTTYESNVSFVYVIVNNNGTSITYRMTAPDGGHTPSGTLENVDKMLKMIGLGPVNLNNNTTIIDVSTGNPPVQPIIHSGTTDYTIYLTGYGGLLTPVSLNYKFKINHDLRRYRNHQVAFLNRHGSFSYFTFTGKMIESSKREYQTYLKNKYYLNASNKWVSDSTKRGDTIYSTKSYGVYTFNSDYIRQSTFNFMEELFTSPEVYYLSELGIIPLIITDVDWENKTIDNEKVINFNIKCKSSNEKNINI